MASDPPVHWVVGARGLLGQAVGRALSVARVPVHRSRVPWTDPARAVEALAYDARVLIDRGESLRLVWCAGSGVVGSRRKDLDNELWTLGAFLDRLSVLDGHGGAHLQVFLASSAGGVYAGAEGAPFTEDTQPRAISPYGEAKLEAERLVRRLAADTGASVLIGRIANLYGPGQDLSKSQGFVSQMCRAHLQRQPLAVYVSLDTARDYLYCDDAARMVLAGLDTLGDGHPGSVVVKILASQRPTTLASILGEMRHITRRRPLVVVGQSPNARFQVRDLRFRSGVWSHLDGLASTPLPVGMAATLESIGRQLRAADPLVLVGSGRS